MLGGCKGCTWTLLSQGNALGAGCRRRRMKDPLTATHCHERKADTAATGIFDRVAIFQQLLSAYVFQTVAVFSLSSSKTLSSVKRVVLSMKQNLNVFEFCEWAAVQLVSKKTPRSQSWFLFYFFSFTHQSHSPASPWVEQESVARLSLEPTPQEEILPGVPRRERGTLLGA